MTYATDSKWAFLTIFWVACAASFPSATAAQSSRDDTAVAAATANLTGTLSCTATACHSSARAHADPHKIRGDEFVLWKENGDPHERAYRTLFNDQSLRILVNLGALSNSDGTNQPNTRFPRHRKTEQFDDLFESCRQCHTTANPANDPTKRISRLADRIQENAVGCESCHGPAGRWLDRHFQSDFATLSAREKKELGMIDTKDVRQRARVCTNCHVGSEGREVNHDLLAAGHPALFFEQASYLAILPPHWRQTDPASLGRRRRIDEPLKDWLAGRWAIIEASLAQTQRRASAASDTNVANWPEFAEYACFSCHHELSVGVEWRSERKTASHRMVLPWAAWNLDSAERLLPLLVAKRPINDSTHLNFLRMTMESTLVPSPEDVIQNAQSVIHSLSFDESLLDPAANTARVRNSVSEFVSDTEQGDVPESWEHAAQSYLALLAWSRCLDPRSTTAIRADLDAVRQRLSFPDGEFKGVILNSPKVPANLARSSSASDVRQKLRDILQQLRNCP